MKIRMVFVLLLITVMGMKAQESKYFQVCARTERSIGFEPKGIYWDVNQAVNDPSPGFNFYVNEDFIRKASECFTKAFGIMNDPDKLPKVHFFFRFNKTLNMHHYFFVYPKDKLDMFPSMEEKIYQFIQLIREMDISPYVRIWNKDTFLWGDFQLNLIALATYAKDPKSVNIPYR